jgi:uncharacterized membrane protein
VSTFLPPSAVQYFPVSLPFLLILAALLAMMGVLVALRLLRYASESMQVSEPALILILGLSLLGSYINIPVAHLPAHRILSADQIDFFGITYVIPVLREARGTIIAVNVGGAVIPVVLSLYLLVRHRLYVLAAIATTCVAIVTHWLAHPVPGFGIALPIFVPASVTAIIALALTRRRAAPLAYISGSCGVLIGADLMNLGAVPALGAPIASIGGAGTFDGIYLTGLLALLYAGLSRYLTD